MKRVALFTKVFLEPTHHAIAAVLRELTDYEFGVFAKSFQSPDTFEIPTVRRTMTCSNDVVEALRSYPCDWVHAIFDGDIALRAAGAARQLGLPLILSFHGGFDTKAKIHDPLYCEITRQAAQDAARVTVVSHADARRLVEIGVTRNVDVVRVPFDSRVLPRPRRTRGMLIAVGRLIEKKGFDLALRALSMLPASYSLTIVGDGPKREPWTALAQELQVANRVEWVGAVPLQQCLELVSLAFALVHPGRIGQDGNAEGTPQVIIWAQAMGIPVVCGNSGDLSEIVSDDSGVRVDSERPEQLANAVLALESSDFAKYIIAAARNAVASHSLEDVISQWRSIYEEVARSCAGPA